MVRVAPATRGGQRKAGTVRPAACAAAPRRRAASANWTAGRLGAGDSFTAQSVAPGYDAHPRMWSLMNPATAGREGGIASHDAGSPAESLRPRDRAPGRARAG